MLKKLLITIMGKTIARKLNIQDDLTADQTAPQPGQALISVPWYESRTKLTIVVGVVLAAVEQLSGPVFGHPVVIPQEVYRLLEAVGLYTLRDAIKKPA